MRKPFVAGNWKMNGDGADATELVNGILAGLDGRGEREVLLCPPFVYLEQVGAMLAGTGASLGAQNVASETGGAYTGEVSAAMLADIGCTHVIVGHSERRSLLGETDAVIARKFMLVQECGLTPVFCVGETLEQRRAGDAMDVIARQVSAVVDTAGIQALGKALVAYEPVWAIGTGQTATPDQAQEIHAGLRALVASHDANIAADLRILYGGSVKAFNAGDLFRMDDIDGGLIGGASLDSTEFLAICGAAVD
jgi:triosephosphate isomerase